DLTVTGVQTCALPIWGRTDAVLMGPGTFDATEGTRVVSLAAKHRLPTIYQFKDAVVAGGLMAYGVHLPDQFRRAAYYVDRILKEIGRASCREREEISR